MSINKPTKVITHTAVSNKRHTAADVGQWHFDRWQGYRPSRIRSDIQRYSGYHIIINYDGSWEQCRAFDEEGVHCRGENFSSVGVCFMGNGDIHKPSSEQADAWINEVWPMIKKSYPNISLQEIYPHRKYANKSCHGGLLADDYYILLISNSFEIDANVELMRHLQQIIKRLLVLLAKDRMK